MTTKALLEKRAAAWNAPGAEASDKGGDVAENGFGPHLMLDCRGCNPERIGDVAHIFNVLNELPEIIGMTKITQPYVFPYSGLVPEDKGVTGIVVIAESHLSFHSFTEKDYFFFDLFSCKPFDVEKAMRYIIDAFEVRDAEVHYVERGRDFPRGEAPVSVALSSVAPEHSMEPTRELPGDRVLHLSEADLARKPVQAAV